MRGEQALFNLEIKKKRGLNINPDIHHSKVFSSGKMFIFRPSRSVQSFLRLLDTNKQTEKPSKFIDCGVIQSLI